MATILTKRSNTASSVPVAGDLTNSTGGAELAVNTADKRLFTKDSGGTVVELGTNPSSVTLPNGTANGVPYLNGSKVLTSGSALTFDGTNLGVPRILQSGSGTYGVFNSSGAGNAWASYQYNGSEIGEIGQGSGIISGGSNTDFGIRSTNNLVFAISYNEQMRLTSTGLGIGTSSPAQKLDVRGGSIVVDTASAGLNPTVFFDHDNFASGTRNYIQMNRGTEAMLFGVANADRMTLDSSGNLGLGVTPSAWGSGRRALQIAGSAANYFMGANANATVFGTNFFYDDAVGNNKYVATGAASMLLQSGGAFQFFTAPSGTAGNAISFTQAMTLDASGTLLVGGTSVVGSAVAPKIYVENSASNGTGGIQIGSYKPALVFTDFSTGNHNYQIASDGGALTFGYEAGTAGSSNTFTERARIDSSGTLLVGQTTNPATSTLVIKVPTGSANGVNAQITSNTGTSYPWSNYNATGTYVGGISCTSTGTAFPTTSDYRLKHDIQPMTGALAKVAALKPVTYKWNLDDSHGEGFIAHELAEVVPVAVIGEKDAVDAEGKPVYQGIDTSFLVATLTAAIQELKAEFDAYKASHP